MNLIKAAKALLEAREDQMITWVEWQNLATALAQSKPLRDEMTDVVHWVWKRAQEMRYEPDDHHALFHEAAVEFDLYDAGTDGEHHAPIWLSRVVAGVLQDKADGLKMEDAI